MGIKDFGDCLCMSDFGIEGINGLGLEFFDGSSGFIGNFFDFGFSGYVFMVIRCF